MVTVIVPALNEEKTIGQVINLVRKSELVNEILVIDDKSNDNTIKASRLPDVKIYTSSLLGKGASMRDGMMLATNEIVVYLDADIVTYPQDVVELLAQPIIEDRADFVKSCFDRQAGRVTELVAKPLLTLLFPDLMKLSQPLSGMIAARKSLLKKIEFENDYGVDIGILLDMYAIEARIVEVNIGYIENRMQPWEGLAKMSREVSRAILGRVKNLGDKNLETMEHINIIRTQMDYAIRESLRGLDKMIIFDMDNTILLGSYIATAADAFGFKDKLIKIVTENPNPFTRTKSIARLLKGKSFDEILSVADRIEIVKDAPYVIHELKTKGYICGIISDSYDVVTNHIKNKLKMDFSIANELEFSKSVATGEVKIPSAFIRNNESKCSHEVCKSNVLSQLAENYKIDIKNIISVGDSENDICLIKGSGIGVAFCSDNSFLNLVADRIIKEKSFINILEFAY
ncbi:MAG TPA: HAD-IB family phosphatase [Bacteroidales bacterium]|nr:HAD-IB family phosphatase [Bacteroidales bacterium]